MFAPLGLFSKKQKAGFFYFKKHCSKPCSRLQWIGVFG